MIMMVSEGDNKETKLKNMLFLSSFCCSSIVFMKDENERSYVAIFSLATPYSHFLLVLPNHVYKVTFIWNVINMVLVLNRREMLNICKQKALNAKKKAGPFK